MGAAADQVKQVSRVAGQQWASRWLVIVIYQYSKGFWVMGNALGRAGAFENQRVVCLGYSIDCDLVAQTAQECRVFQLGRTQIR